MSTRWRIAILISCAIAISYFDRQTLSVAINAIQREIPLSNTRFSDLQSAFLVAYALMYALGGRLIDVLGTRAGFLAIMVWWSLACASHGLAGGFAALVVSRFLLGMGEGGGFPAATKAVAEWFPAGERSFAMGIINASTAVGAVIAPPGIALVLAYSSWRWVFFLSGAIGLLWSCWWWLDYRAAPVPTQSSKEEDLSWRQLFIFPQTWGLVGAKFLSDSAWYFYLFWLPKYLYDARGFNVKAVGYFAWIPYAAAGVGCLVGGWFSGWLLRRGHSLNVARKMALGLSAALMPSIIFVTQVPVAFAIVLFSVVFFGQQSWSTLIMVLPADLFPRKVVASVAGLVGCGGAIGGSVFALLVGYLLDHGHGYGIVFSIVATLHVLAFLLILVTMGEMRPVHLSER
ncbi:MAG: MFS transporter [Acidobacteriota bacterium]|nr:MFS transporter [Acidobacteriota bacterium]